MTTVLKPFTSPIPHCLQQFFSRYQQQTIIVAFSGGVDSMVLLHALAKLKQQGDLSQSLLACHVNHGLSAHAELWEKSAQQLGEALNIDVVTQRVTIDVNNKQSIEALAREARYQALIALSEQPALIVTGHHSDDQSETFLLALKRGAGIKGLAAMACETPLAQHLLVRPLLAISQQEILDYAEHHQLTWHEDESNQDVRFDRNFFRQDILPQIQQRWPSFASTVVRSAQHCRDAQSLLDEVAEQDLAPCLAQDSLAPERLLSNKLTSEQSLLVPALLALSANRFNNVMRYFLALNHKRMPSTEQLKQLRNQLTAPTDKNPAINIDNYWLRRFKNQLYLTAELADVSHWQHKISLATLTESVAEKYQLSLPDNIGEIAVKLATQPGNSYLLQLDYQSENTQQTYQLYLAHVSSAIVSQPNRSQPLTIAFGHQNPTCLPDYRHKSRPLKKVLQELNIPTWQRTRIPFLYFGDELVAALGYFICQPYLVKKKLG